MVYPHPPAPEAQRAAAAAQLAALVKQHRVQVPRRCLSRNARHVLLALFCWASFYDLMQACHGVLPLLLALHSHLAIICTSHLSASYSAPSAAFTTPPHPPTFCRQ